ncbi:MAG: hypothetical protein CVV49_19460 [Spirochaetae bacterium HGW-Spirochaetae-5]|nr:MAG: hypothetical protein CVV49_19460 [Spirochaetae bacterium HGW-Spirochaetae-5]
MKRLTLCAVLIILSAFTACDDMFNDAFSDATPKVKYFGYVTTTTNRLYSYRVMESGIFEAVSTPATIVSTIANPARITIHPSNDFIYVAAQTFILAYKVNDDGSLTSVGQFFNGISSSLVAIHPSGEFLYSISNSNSIIQFYRINSDGSLVYVTQHTPAIITPTNCALKVNPSGTRLYVTAVNGTTSYIISYGVLSDGQLTDEKQSSINNATAYVGKSIYINKNGSHLYSTGGLGSSYIIGFILNSDGTATFNHLTTSTNSRDIVVNQSETFLYSSETQAGKGIMMYGIYSDYSLYSIGYTPVLAATPSFMGLHPDGRFLYQADTTNKFITVYNMNQGGNLTYNGIACTFNNASEYTVDVKIAAKTVYGAN